MRSETVYGITSLFNTQANASRLLSLNRGHWEIENRVHWVRDVTFKEDLAQIRTKSGPRVMATLRNISTSIMRMGGIGNITKGSRMLNSSTPKAMRLIGFSVLQ